MPWTTERTGGMLLDSRYITRRFTLCEGPRRYSVPDSEAPHRRRAGGVPMPTICCCVAGKPQQPPWTVTVHRYLLRARTSPRHSPSASLGRRLTCPERGRYPSRPRRIPPSRATWSLRMRTPRRVGSSRAAPCEARSDPATMQRPTQDSDADEIEPRSPAGDLCEEPTGGAGPPDGGERRPRSTLCRHREVCSSSARSCSPSPAPEVATPVATSVVCPQILRRRDVPQTPPRRRSLPRVCNHQKKGLPCPP